jgi:SAM-dependent methyltransferase
LNLRSHVPWYGKMAAKVVLSRLPAAYSLWRHRLFTHGSMDEPKYASDVFASHFDRASFARKHQEFVGLELGPGDSVISALIASAHGASRCHLVDAGDFATRELANYRRAARYLCGIGLQVPDLEAAETFDDVLRLCRARYATRSLDSLREIATASVDFIWSHAVLEHVRRDAFGETMKELRRVLRSDGICSHRVDLRDHLGGGLDNMRLPSRWWEQEWMAKSGFYTNRLRYSELLAAFRSAGFDTEVELTLRWDSSPLPRRALAREFQHLDETDLTVYAFDVLLRPA